MGLFSRKKSEQNTRSASRTATSSEAQAAELRGRARRRLIGALVLVLTAIIVVPMMFDDTTTQQQDTPVVLPSIVPPVPEPELAAVTQSDFSVDSPVLSEDAVTASQTGGAITLPNEPEPLPAEPEAPASAAAAEAAPVEPRPDAQTQEKPPQAKPKPATEKPTQPPAAASDARTDDGSVALALLEGRVPVSTPSSSASSAQQQGAFILQIAAYSTEADAEKRRSSLISSGVTNAYVERATSNNKATYRLRVGSFPTRDAAQAAQARLRALGYDNSMLLAQ